MFDMTSGVVQVPARGFSMSYFAMLISAGLTSLFLVPSLSAQQASATPRLIPRSTQEQNREWELHHRISLIVQVTNASGKPVTGLTREDFTILDNQRPQPVLSFTAVNGATASAPPHVILVLDGVNDSSGYLAAALKGIEELLRPQTQLPYAVSIATMTKSGLEIGGSSRSTDALSNALAVQARVLRPQSCRYDNDAYVQTMTSALPGSVSFDRSSQNPDCLNQRFVLSIAQIQKFAAHDVVVPGRDLVIWLGPGWPLLNGPGFSPDTADTKQNFFDILVDLTNGLRESQVTLYSISAPGTVDGSLRKPPSFSAVAEAADASAATLALQRLVRQAGGLVIGEKTHISGAITRCMADADAWYALSFTSAPVTTVELRSIRVMVDRPGLTVRTNTEYYAEP